MLFSKAERETDVGHSIAIVSSIQARTALVERLTTDGSVSDYLLRFRAGNAVWVEVTARADPPARIRARSRRSYTSAAQARRRNPRHLRQLLQAKMAALRQTISGVAHG